MKVYLDRNHCAIHQAGCESCFGGRIELVFTGKAEIEDITMAGCVMEIAEEDDMDNVTFYMKDRNGIDKELYVNKENWPDAYNSWMLLYEKQMTEKMP